MREAELDRIAEAAAELPESERQAFVFDACRGDESAIQAVWKFLDFDPPSGFIPDKARSGLDLIGSRIGGYAIVSHLGEGGSSVVYGVARSGGSEPEFALKLLRREFRDRESVVARFRVEQEVLNRLQHLNVASLVQSGSFQGRPFFVMELVRNSRPITSYCQEQKLDLTARLRLFESTCDAVVHAHQQGILHRDIKPANILVQKDPTTGVASPKLIDFGIAKALEPDYFESMIETAQGEFIGTRSHASPEQIMGIGTDTRTDIYGLGLVLYELLTDKPVVDVSVRPDAEQLRQTICEAIPEKPSVRNADPHRRVPQALDWITLMALDKQPSSRYQTVDALLSDVRNLRFGKRVRAQPRSLCIDIRTFIAEYSVLSLGISALVVSLLLTGWYARQSHRSESHVGQLLSQVQKESEEKSSALKKLQQADAATTANLLQAKKINQALFKVISPPREFTFGEFEITHRERLRQATQEITSSLAGEPLVEANVRWVLAETFTQYGDLALALQEAEKSVERYEDELGPTDSDTLRAKQLVADLLRRNGQFERAYRAAQSVLSVRRQKLGEQEELTSHSRVLLSNICGEMGRYEEGIAHLNAIEMADDEAEWTVLAESVVLQLAKRYRSLGKNQEASQQFFRLLKHQKAKLGESHERTLSTQYELAGLYLLTRNAKEAETLYRDALAKLKKHDPGNLLSINLTRDLAAAVSWQGRDREAESLLLETISQQQRMRASSHFGEPISLCRYARLLRDRKAYDDAERIMRFVIRQQTRSHPDSDRSVAASIETMASIYGDQSIHQQELYWRMRLFTANLRHYGLMHEATLNTGRKLARAFGLNCGYGCSIGLSVVALDRLLEIWKSNNRPAKMPLVVKRDGRLALEWSDSPLVEDAR